MILVKENLDIYKTITFKNFGEKGNKKTTQFLVKIRGAGKRKITYYESTTLDRACSI